MRVLVTGSRNFSDYERLKIVLDSWHEDHGPITLLIHGAARGADQLADRWAQERGVKVLSYPADWSEYGRAAGPIRNAQMLHQSRPDIVLAFPPKTSEPGRGTRHMINIAEKAGVPVYTYG